MKVWVDDVRTAPDGYVWCRSVNEAIEMLDKHLNDVELLDLDHDAGDYAGDGGDYIRILDWLEMTVMSDCPFPIRIHSMNVVGVGNMRRIIRRRGWCEIQ